MTARIPAHVREQQIDDLPNIRFVRWDGEYRNSRSKAVCSCAKGHEWSARVTDIIFKSSSCPKCSNNRLTDETVRIDQINNIEGVTFVRWENGYRGANSKAVCTCDRGHEWSSSICNLVNHTTRCPACSWCGYNPDKPATLYALRSKCGNMVKIGISNNYEQRHAILKRKTPFRFECVELCHGDGSLVATLEKVLHDLMKPVNFDRPFDGSTEWREWDDRLPMWFEMYRSWS